jgi:hypothetical protein
MHIGLNNSTSGVNYQLYTGTAAVGTAVAGSGSTLDFGAITTAGTYTVKAVNTATGCTAAMTGSAAISINTLPTVVSVTGGGSYCSGSTGVAVGLNASVGGTNYQLYFDGGAAGTPVAGVGGALSFGLQTNAGIYTVVAINATTGCTSNMSGSATVTANPLPNVYTMTGGGSYCTGGSGVAVGLGGSSSGVTYKLYRSGTPVSGGTVSGTGASVSFGAQTVAGAYTATAVNNTSGCTSNMSGSVSVSVNPLPGAGTITGPTTLYNGGTVNLTDASSGGVWTSSNPPAMTIGSSTGIVTGVAAGYSNIMYTVTTACGSAYTIVTLHDLGPVIPAQSGLTSGNTNICVGGTTTLSNTVSGGTWSVSDADIASVDPQSGIVTGHSAGAVAVTYTLNTANGIAQVFTPVIVNAAPDAVTVASNPGTTVAQGQKVILTASVNNGSPVKAYQWFVNNTPVSGATSATYTSSNFANNDEVACMVLGECGEQPLTASVVITIDNESVLGTQAGSSDIKVVPNPSKGTFMIKGTTGSAADEEVTYTITDVLGQVVYSNKVIALDGVIDQLVQLSSAVPNGMYLLTVHSATQSAVFHVVVAQ